MELVALPPYHGGINGKFVADSVLTGSTHKLQSKPSPLEYLIVEMILLIPTASMQY